jgi:hypothetical protein
MEHLFFSLEEANAKIGKKVWVKVHNLYTVKIGITGTVTMAVCLDQVADEFGVRVDWKLPLSASDTIITVFTKNEYQSYLNEEADLPPRITSD